MTEMPSEFKRLSSEYRWHHSLVQNSDRHFENASYDSPHETYSEEQINSLGHGQANGSWWFSTRNEIIAKAVANFGNGGCLWEIGSGAGAVGVHLSNAGIPCIGVEPSGCGSRHSSERGLLSIQSDFQSLKLPAKSVYQIGLFDVLEHVQSPNELLTELRFALKDDGRLFITVPAYSFLWSNADETAGHFLRYTRRSIVRQLHEVGFRPIYVRYFFTSLVLPLLVLRVIPYRLGFERFRKDDGLINLSGGQRSVWLQKVEMLMNKFIPIGSSIIVVASKDIT